MSGKVERTEVDVGDPDHHRSGQHRDAERLHDGLQTVELGRHVDAPGKALHGRECQCRRVVEGR